MYVHSKRASPLDSPFLLHGNRIADSLLCVLLLPDKCSRAEDSGILALDSAGQNFDLILEYRQHILLHIPLRRLEQELTRLCQTTEEEDCLGRRDDNSISQCASEHLSGVAGSPFAAAAEIIDASKSLNEMSRNSLASFIFAINSKAVRLIPVAETYVSRQPRRPQPQARPLLRSTMT